MRRIMFAFLGVFAILGAGINYASNVQHRRSDSYIRERVLMLTGKDMECSAIEIKAPSGKVYTLSAAHCSEMLQLGLLTATAEDGTVKVLKMIALGFAHDLMLLEAFDKNSIPVAKKVHKHQKVHTLTHGHSMPTYRTDGELLEEKIIAIGESIWDDDGMEKCSKLGRQLIMSMDGFSCMFKLNVMMSTAQVMPGSSGGAVLNSEGELVGVVSATDGYFSAFVPLKDIQSFLKGR